MSKVLVRNNAEGTVLEDAEFISTALVQISSTALSLKDVTESEQLLIGMSDILELMQEVLSRNNIQPMKAVQYAAEVRANEGSFNSKKAVDKE